MAAQKQDKLMKNRKANLYEPINKYYIFCEGEKTEPNYFLGFKKAIETNPIYEDRVIIHIEGTGSETIRVTFLCLSTLFIYCQPISLCMIYPRHPHAFFRYKVDAHIAPGRIHPIAPVG